MNDPSVLVVIPVFNGEETLKEAVDSVLNQTYQNFHLVIVDDGSSDRSLKIAGELAKNSNKIDLIAHENNLGVCQTRNDGAGFNNSAYISFLDQNDYYEKEFLSKTVDILDNYSIVDVVKVGVAIPLKIDKLRYLVIYDSIPNNQLIRRYAFEFVGGFPVSDVFQKEFAGEDIALNTLLHQVFNVGKIEDKLYNYIPHEGCHLITYLNRTRVENNKIIFERITDGDKAVERKIRELSEDLRRKVRNILASSEKYVGSFRDK